MHDSLDHPRYVAKISLQGVSWRPYFDREAAAAAEMTRNTGRTSSMLAGVPLALKGNWALKGVPMNTQRTGLLRDHTPSWTATVVHAAPFLLALQACTCKCCCKCCC